jgi:hypothetical protein
VPSAFDASQLAELASCTEVTIRTERHPDTPVVIWIVADGGEVFVRSVRGAKGRWFRDLQGGGKASLEWGGRRVPVTAIPATDADSVARASRQYLAKYRTSPYAEPMVRPEVLLTTLRLEPR